LLCVAASAAPAPAITRIFEAPGPVSGGLAGDGSNLYFTTLAKQQPGGGWNYSQVISLTDSGACVGHGTTTAKARAGT